MNAFDRFLSSAKSATQSAGKKANEMIEYTKLSMSISDLNGQISRDFEAIGKLIYQSYKSEPQAAEVMKKCAEVEEKYAQIEELRAKINEVKNLVICEKCKTANSKENTYCSKCGEKLKPADYTADYEDVVEVPVSEKYTEAPLNDDEEG